MGSFDEIWEEIHASQDWGKYPSEPVIRFVARNYYQKDRKNIKILDFGCGAGSHTWYLAKEKFDVYAFDGSKSAVKKVTERLDQEGLSADLRVSDALELDYENEFFDCVIDNATICANRYQNIVNMYQKIFEMLRGGGNCFLYHSQKILLDLVQVERLRETHLRIFPKEVWQAEGYHIFMTKMN